MRYKKKRHSMYLCMAVIALIITCMIVGDTLLSDHLSYILPFVSYGGTFKWAYLKMGSVKISLYWSTYVVGISFMIRICIVRRNCCNLNKTQAVLTAIMLVIAGFVGAKLLFVIENYKYIIENHINLGMGGISYFGTVFFIPVIIPVISKILKVDKWEYLDYCTPAGLIMLACIRCGCYMRGCCHGITVWLGSKPFIFPVQLMECTMDLFLLDCLLRFEEEKKYQKGRYIIFMGSYGIIRFLLEFLRDTPKDVLCLSNGQWFSGICIGILIVYWMRRRATT